LPPHPSRGNPPAEFGTAQPAPDAWAIAIMVERGRAFFEAGDLAAARLLFHRAANAGDAAAALAMGATYDPIVLAGRLVRGLGADAEQARTWYERARELGSPEGPRRLETMAHR
jgi:TPR repeat protein